MVGYYLLPLCLSDVGHYLLPSQVLMGYTGWYNINLSQPWEPPPACNIIQLTVAPKRLTVTRHFKKRLGDRKNLSYSEVPTLNTSRAMGPLRRSMTHPLNILKYQIGQLLVAPSLPPTYQTQGLESMCTQQVTELA